ncbi:hypothetical protein GGF43_001654 [Coemansia sp. RSA 2618]|nr:hypothetical protein GGF43_001654 [Coemansia sp. RSA 2618]
MAELRKKWEDLKRVSLLSAAHLRALTFTASSKGTRLPLLSLRWRLFLDVLPIEHFGQDDAECQQVWGLAADRERQNYAALRAQYIVDPSAQAREETDWKRMNPLSLDEDSPWHRYHKDQELRTTILQDVTRTFPEEAYFRQPRVQRLMADMLFVYAKMHSNLQYRQGMHELLAPLLLAVERDAVDRDAEGAFPAKLLDRRFVEHDAFALFERLMRMCMAWYQTPPLVSPSKARHASVAQTPIIAQCQMLLDKLMVVDAELATHLQRLDIEPQLFGIRWYRLLFSRELSRLRDVFALWDMVLADSTAGSLRLVDWVGMVFLVANRRQLLHGDYEDNLTTLLHLPPLPRPSPETLEQTPPLPNTPLSPKCAAFPALDTPVVAPKIPYAALVQPGTLPIQRLALQAAYLRNRPTQETALLVARQYAVWEEEAWDVIDDADASMHAMYENSSESAASNDSGAQDQHSAASVPISAPVHGRKMYTSSTLQQRRANGSAVYGMGTSPRSLPSSPPHIAGLAGAIGASGAPAALEPQAGVMSVLSPGETLLSLGSATAQATGIAAQCLDMLAAQPNGDKQKAETIAGCLHRVSRIWQDEVVRLSDQQSGAAGGRQRPQGMAESELRRVLRQLDAIYVDVSNNAALNAL